MTANARWKSLFPLPAALLSTAFALLAVFWIVAGGHDRIAWCGVLIANAVLPTFLAWLQLGNVRRTSEYLPFLLLASIAGPVLAAWEVFAEGAANWPVLVPAVIGTALLALYVFWYSRFDRQPSEALAVGKKLRPFDLAAADGAIFRSAELHGAPAVLVFYRGNWCPLCMAQVRELAGRYQDIEALGATVVLISPQEAGYSKQLSERLGVDFRLLVDETNSLAEKLGIAIRNGVPLGQAGGFSPDTVMPTVIAVNASGTIVYSDQTDNYRLRPEPDIYMAILRRAGAINK
jgi:peroxiredoxin